jgi:hypothetical protein
LNEPYAIFNYNEMKIIVIRLIVVVFLFSAITTFKLNGQPCEMDTFILNNYFADAEMLAIKEIQASDDHLYKDSVFVPITLRDKYLKILSSIYRSPCSTFVDSIFKGNAIHMIDRDQMILLEVDTIEQWVKNLKADSSESDYHPIDTILSGFSMRLSGFYKEWIFLKSQYLINYKPLLTEFIKMPGVSQAEVFYNIEFVVPIDCGDRYMDDIELLSDLKTLRFIWSANGCSDYCFTKKFWEFTITGECKVEKIRSYCNTGNRITEYADLAGVYPNPFSDRITISNHDRVNNLSVYDITGSRVYHENSPRENIHLGKLPKGTYFLKLKMKDDFKIYKIIKL